MTNPKYNVDFARLAETAQALGHALGLRAVPADALERTIRTILDEKAILECVADGLITEEEAANGLMDRVMNWMLVSQSTSHHGLADYSRFQNETLTALFGERCMSRASR
jgi:hypothetical protein